MSKNGPALAGLGLPIYTYLPHTRYMNVCLVDALCFDERRLFKIRAMNAMYVSIIMCVLWNNNKEHNQPRTRMAAESR